MGTCCRLSHFGLWALSLARRADSCGSQYIGPLGGLIGSSGGDVANEFTFVVTALTYAPARYLELKYIGR